MLVHMRTSQYKLKRQKIFPLLQFSNCTQQKWNRPFFIASYLFQVIEAFWGSKKALNSSPVFCCIFVQKLVVLSRTTKTYSRLGTNGIRGFAHSSVVTRASSLRLENVVLILCRSSSLLNSILLQRKSGVARKRKMRCARYDHSTYPSSQGETYEEEEAEQRMHHNCKSFMERK